MIAFLAADSLEISLASVAEPETSVYSDESGLPRRSVPYPRPGEQVLNLLVARPFCRSDIDSCATPNGNQHKADGHKVFAHYMARGRRNKRRPRPCDLLVQVMNFLMIC